MTRSHAGPHERLNQLSFRDRANIYFYRYENCLILVQRLSSVEGVTTILVAVQVKNIYTRFLSVAKHTENLNTTDRVITES